MLKRNENSDRYKIAMDKIRKTFSKELDADQTRYKIYHKNLEPRKIFTGGMVDITATLNSIFIGLPIAIIFAYFSFDSWVIIAAFIIGFLLSLFLHMIYVCRKYAKSFKKLKAEEEEEENTKTETNKKSQQKK